jgi:hypothetical protein
MVATGDIVVPVRQRFSLEDTADAHRALEGRFTVGGSVLTLWNEYLSLVAPYWRFLYWQFQKKCFLDVLFAETAALRKLF